jgi:hypothetical protein
MTTEEMTREEAREIIERILAKKAVILRTRYFNAKLEERGYRIFDAKKILAERNVEADPEYDAEFSNFKVRLRGCARDGRETRLVVGLRFYGENVYINMIDLRSR